MKLNNSRYKNPSLPPKLGPLREMYALKSFNNYLFVEGSNQSNDKTVYEKVKSNSCLLQYGGTKENIINEFKLLNFKNQIAIVDKDYDEYDYNNYVFCTDKNDVESTAIYLLNESYSDVFSNYKIDRSKNNDEQQKKVFDLAIKITKDISIINKQIHFYNIENSKYYKYLLNFNKSDKLSFFYILNNILDKNYNININEVNALYKSEYNDFTLNFTFDNNESIDCFRGHDFFMVLAYLFKKFDFKLLYLDFSYSDKPEDFLERKFIERFAENKTIKNSDLYNNVKLNTSGFFE